MQDSISTRVAAELTQRLTGDEKTRLAKRYTADPVAYELYLRGLYFWSTRTREGTTQAIDYFQRALARDPRYALAHAGLADCFRGLPIRTEMRPSEAFPKAKEAALAAVAIDAALPEAHAAIGWIKYFHDWDWAGAETDLRRALELNPNYPHARLGLAHVLATQGRHEEGVDQMNRALAVDPLSSMLGAIKGQVLLTAGLHSLAVAQLQKVLEVQPDFWIAQVILGQNYERQGRYEEALEQFRKTRLSTRGLTQPVALMGYTYGVMGRREEAERILAELLTLSKDRYVPRYNVAVVHQGLGNTEEALRWLEMAYEERDVHMVFLGVDSKWDGLRDHPRFVDLIKRMNLKPAGDRTAAKTGTAL